MLNGSDTAETLLSVDTCVLIHYNPATQHSHNVMHCILPIQPSESPWKFKVYVRKNCCEKWGGLGCPISGDHVSLCDN